MSLSRVKTIEKINGMLAEMSKSIVVGKIRTPYLHPESSELPSEIVRDGYQWMVAIYQGAFQRVIAIWKLCKLEIWDMYFRCGDFEDHAEVKLLRAALVNLKKTMNNRPALFTKSKIEKIMKRMKKNG